MIGQGGMQHPGNFRPGRQPARNLQPRLFLRAKTQMQGAQPAQRQRRVIGTGADGEGVEGRAQLLRPMGVGGDQADQQIGVAGEIFGAGVNREIDSMRMGREEQGRRPGVVEDNADIFLMRGGGDGGHILHLHRLRAGRLQQHRRRLRPDQLRNVAADLRIVIIRGHAKALENCVAEGAGRLIGGIDDENMRAGMRRGQ